MGGSSKVSTLSVLLRGNWFQSGSTDSGVSEEMVMKIGGWKTKAMFSRCNVANKDRLRAAMVTGGRHVEPMSQVAEQGGAR
jgi:hypothetical protein